MFDVKIKRNEWKQKITGELSGRLVFLDESSVNIDLTRRYGRGLSGKRVIDHTPLNTPRITTILSSVRLNGEKAFTVYSGGTTGPRFLEYLDNVLIPTLHSGDIIVMDNMRSHHIKEVAKHLEKHKLVPCYLPPYSPDLNPIEKMWSKVKAILRKWKIRSADQLKAAVKNALCLISNDDVAHWFNYCLHF